MSDQALNLETMSDDEIMALDFSAMDFGNDNGTVDEPPTDLPPSEVDDEEDEPTEQDEPIHSQEEEEEDEPESEEEEPEEDPVEPKETPEGSVDYKSQVDELFSPFKANGRDMKVESIDEARRLMSMGANYNKKMQALNPHLKTIKTLEKHELLDENKLNLMIAVSKNDKEAIKQVIRDSGIDLAELDFDEGSANYTPENFTVSSEEVAMDTVLEDLKSTPTFARTVNEVTKVWDDASRAIVKQNPESLRVINEHMENGIYDRVRNEVERRRMFGQITPEVSDINAYYMVGNDMFQRGEFNEPTAQKNDVTPPAESAKQDAETRKRKALAASPRGRRASPQNDISQYDPTNMTDEEIEAACAKFGIR